MANKDYSKMSTKAKPEKVKDTETKPLTEIRKRISQKLRNQPNQQKV